MLEDSMVEEGKASFDPVRHRNPVTLRRKQVGLEKCRQLEPRGTLERAPATERPRELGTNTIERCARSGFGQ